MSRREEKETSRSEANARLQKLEQMVHGFFQQSGVASPITYTPPQASTGGHLRQGTEASYVGANHWEAILESIHDIQDYFKSDSDNSTTPSSQEESTSSVDIVFAGLEPCR